MRLTLATLGLAVAMLAGGVRGGDPAAADALWAYAVAESSGDYTHPLFIDATRELARLRPWQEGYGQARERMRWVFDARRSALDPAARPR